jgi:hypothetical protein
MHITIIEERDGVVHAEVFERAENGERKRVALLACRGSSSGLRAVRELARLADEGGLSIDVDAGASDTG